MSWHLQKQVGVIAYLMYRTSVTFLQVRRINIEIKKKQLVTRNIPNKCSDILKTEMV